MASVVFFYPDLRSSQGWPDMLSPLFNNLAADMGVTFLGTSREKTEGSASIFDLAEKEYIGSPSWPSLRDQILKDARVISLGVLHFELLKLVLKMPAKSRLIIMPLGHLDKFSLRRDIFSSDPSIAAQESKSASRLQYSKEKRIRFSKGHKLFLDKKSMLTKELFLAALGFLVSLRKISVTIIPLSGNEADNVPLRIRGTLGATITRPLALPFNWNAERLVVAERAARQVGEVQSDVLLRGENKRLNFVYFGRIEIEQKGIDLLLELMQYLKFESALDVRLKVVGPSDQMSFGKVAKLSNDLGVEDTVEWLLPGDYEAGSLEPLASADFSILLSRWDGWPRACQESLALGTPVICSEESNFGDVIKEYQCGLVLPRGEAKRDKFERVGNFLEGADPFELGENAKVAASAFTGESAAQNLVELIRA